MYFRGERCSQKIATHPRFPSEGAGNATSSPLHIMLTPFPLEMAPLPSDSAHGRQ